MARLFLIICGLVTGPVVYADAAYVELEFHVLQGPPSRDIQEVCCADPDLFDTPAVRLARAGLGGAPLWLKLPELRPGSILEISKMVDEAVLYEESAQGWVKSKTGDLVDPAGRALDIHRMAFELSEDIEPDAARFLRISQPNLVSVRLRAWDPRSFRLDFEQHRLFRFLLLGFVFAIVIYNFVISSIARDVVFASNALVILSIVGVDLYLSGYGAAYLWPRPLSNMMLNLALTTTVFFGAAFIRRFLSPELGRELQHPGLGWIARLALGCFALSLALPYWLVQTGLLTLIVALMLWATVIAIRDGVRGVARARLLLLPMVGVMLPGMTLVLARTMGHFAPGFLREHLLEFTLALEALAFSLALAARLRIYAREAETAQNRLVKSRIDAAKRYADLQEKERARIASDLHDSIGHNLVMIGSLLERSLDDSRSTLMERARSVTAQTLLGVRRLSHELHPATLEHLGWEDAVDSLFSSLQEANGIAVDINQIGEQPDLSPECKTHLFRILQEICSNIAKHSHAENCSVTFRNDGNQLKIDIQDDGVGLKNDGAVSPGLGFNSISERVNGLEGNWGISSGSDGGVHVRLSVPLGGAAAAPVS